MRALVFLAVRGSSISAHTRFTGTRPNVSGVEERVEQRLGQALDPDFAATTTITVRADRGHYTAQLELATDTRS